MIPQGEKKKGYVLSCRFAAKYDTTGLIVSSTVKIASITDFKASRRYGSISDEYQSVCQTNKSCRVRPIVASLCLTLNRL